MAGPSGGCRVGPGDLLELLVPAPSVLDEVAEDGDRYCDSSDCREEGGEFIAPTGVLPLTEGLTALVLGLCMPPEFGGEPEFNAPREPRLPAPTTARMIEPSLSPRIAPARTGCNMLFPIDVAGSMDVSGPSSADVGGEGRERLSVSGESDVVRRGGLPIPVPVGGGEGIGRLRGEPTVVEGSAGPP